MKAAQSISARSIKTPGYAATKAGLTASYYKEKGDYHVEAGALVLANNGICCIDEFNLMPTSVRQSLHEAMEHQKFLLMRAGIKVEIQSKFSIFAVMNHKIKSIPKEAKTDCDNEMKVLNMEGSLASRFDLILMLENSRDNFNMDTVDHMLNSVSIGCKREALECKSSSWDLKRLQRHVIYAKELDVKITDDVRLIINQYFGFCQTRARMNASRTTMRMKNSLERLTVSHAKMMLRKKTRIIDIMTIIWFMENSWTGGDLINPVNLLNTEQFDIGPSDECIEFILQTLKLPYLIEVYQQEKEDSFNESLSILDETDYIPEQLKRSFAINSIDDLFGEAGPKDEENCQQLDNDEDFLKTFGDAPAKEKVCEKEKESPPQVFNSFEVHTKQATTIERVNESRKTSYASNDLEDSLNTINALLGMKTNEMTKKSSTKSENPRTLFPIIQERAHESLPKQSQKRRIDPPKAPSSSFADMLKRFRYSSQQEEEEEHESSTERTGESSSQLKKKQILDEKNLFDELDENNFDPWN
jgi:hypothetical protein